MLTQLDYKEPTDPMPCRVEKCGEPFIEWETKLCVEHRMDLMEMSQQDNRDEI